MLILSSQAEEAEKERQAQELEKQREREALALAILNGTADKLELERREREENEWVTQSYIMHWLEAKREGEVNLLVIPGTSQLGLIQSKPDYKSDY